MKTVSPGKEICYVALQNLCVLGFAELGWQNVG